ncbi:MAG TPA: hypothetical protein VMT04_01825 [Terriglobales bacterium]|nr:hypothetical protein [Terriglobales bacterium]
MKCILRKKSVLPIIPLLICLLSPSLQSQTLGRRTELTLKGNGTTGPFAISQKYILTNTERIQKDTLLLEKGKDYLIDYNKGLVWLTQPLSKDDSLQISFEEFSSSIKKRYFHRELSFSQEAFSSNSLAPSNSAAISPQAVYSAKGIPGIVTSPLSQLSGDKPFSSNLQITGSKSFSFDLGNVESFSLSQGLNLSLSGNLTRDVKVLALLSDQGRGGTLDGTTKNLEELDKVLMQVTSPNFNGYLGDQYLSFDGDLSGRYDKKLEGVSAEGKFGQSSVSASYASSKGKYYLNSFTGVEGRQGPYYLKDENGQRGLQILPGTEKVYLNGNLLTRGSENDYTIDYSRGLINFSSARLVTSDSRIKVEFEYTDQNYERSFYDTKGEWSLLNGKMKLKGLFIDERDDKNNPLSQAFSTQDKEILQNSGEDQSKAFKDGAQYLGSAKGDYNLLTDSSGSSYYQYAGKDSGSYQVNFSWVGSSQGSYLYTGAGIFKYVSPGKGDYLPVVFLPLPSSHSVLDLDMGLDIVPGLTSEIGWGLSKKDLNLFSSKGNENNSGNAFLFKTGFDKQNLGLFGHNLSSLKIEGLYRTLGENFSPFGRTDEIEKDRVWGLFDDSQNGAEEVARFTSTFAPVENLSLDMDLGSLNKGDFFNSKRNGFGVTLRPFKSLEAKASSEDIKSSQKGITSIQEGVWQRRNLSLAHHWKKLSTQFSWNAETQELNLPDSLLPSRKYDELTGSLRLESNNVWSMSTQLIFHNEERKQVSWEKEYDSYTWQNQVSLRNYKDVLSTDFQYAYRTRNLKTGLKEKGNVGAFKLDYIPKSQALVLNLYYSVNQLGAEKSLDNYIDVGSGRGQYRYENGEYIPDPEGNYILQKEMLDEYVPGKQLDKSFRSILYPGKVFPKSKALKQLYTDTFVRFSNLISGPVSWAGFILNPFDRGGSGGTLLRDFSLKQDLNLFYTSPFNLRLRLASDDRENNLLVYGKDSDKTTSQSVLLRYRLSPKNIVESEVTKEKRQRENIAFNLLSINGNSVRLDYTRREKNSLEMTLSSKLLQEDERESGLKVNLMELTPKVSFSLVGQGRLHSEVSWIRVNLSPSGKILPWEMAEGKEAGNNFAWGLIFDYKLSQALSATLNYSGLKEPIRGIRYNGKFEVKAYF